MHAARSTAELLQWISDRRASVSVLKPPARAVPVKEAMEQVVAKAKVERSVVPDAERIRKLPTWSEADFAGFDLTDTFKTPGGTMRLRPLQSLALHWILQQKGLVGMLGTGAGKTLVSLLAATAMGAQRPMLMIPPTMQIPLRDAIEELRHHWRIPKDIFIVPYSQLSVAGSTDLLDRLRPDLIIADECHSVANATAARSKRVMRYFRSFPETRFVALSGTLTGKSLRDYGHLSELALRGGSPLPLDTADLFAWSACVDSESRINDRNLPKESDWRTFGAFCNLQHIPDIDLRREEARKVFNRRLRSTPGVVASKEGSVGCSLLIVRREVSVPSVVDEAMRELRRTWTRPDGEELVSALDLHRCGMEMSQGFFLRWKWPEGVVDHEWMNARAFWHREVRAVLHQNRVGLDSPLLVTRAVQRASEKGDSVPGLSPSTFAAWTGWSAVKHRPKPPTEVVWLDTFLVEDALKWRKKHPEGIIWFSSRAVEEALRVCGERVYGAGENPPVDGKAICLSISSHGTGLNLQKWNENLILSWPSSGKACEQLVSRTHRFGQPDDEVNVWFYGHTVDARLAVKKSREDAAYIEETTGSSQKLNFCTWLQS